MRVVIPLGYIIPLKSHFRDSHVCEVGIIIRSYAFLTLFDWHRVMRPQQQVLLNHLQHDFDIQEIDTTRVRENILWYMESLLKGFGYELHSHWKEVFHVHGVVAAYEASHRSASYEKASQTDIVIRRTYGAARNEKLEEWRRAHPGERMRVVFPLGYVMLFEHHIKNPYVYKDEIIVRVYAFLKLFG
ncbi:hypothetical protein COCNU_08G005910 [Cocos nucifera]|uniref:Uncharacterized protein n=1 Tax=Cocos nucifera TaxID=13894 RepID=A0A8K0N691_COCNU|nr:hypothetical protein COCNU_08G005910 [Cocos nucifera]